VRKGKAVLGLHPIFVIEGPDGTGKSTLAKALCEKLDARYRHLTYRWPQSMDLYHWAGLERCLADSTRQPVVLDRWWPSEIVYAAAFRGGTKWPEWSRMLDRVALKHRVFYILARPQDKDAYVKHYEILKGKRVEMYDSMHKVYDLFGDWQTTMEGRVDFMMYDFMTEGQDIQFDLFLDDLMNRAFDWFAGSRTFGQSILDRRTAGQLIFPEVLFVGDKSNPKNRRGQWPFFDRGGHSSRWLTRTLQQVGIPEYKLAWLNAHDATGRVQFTQDTVEKIGARRVYSLGAQASNTLRKVGVDHKMLYHPQFYKRFDPGLGIKDFAELSVNLNLRPENWNDSAFSNLGLA
jgi:hypothetical protein